METKKCNHEKCTNEIKKGDTVYQENYYGKVFCSLECMTEWTKQDHGWCTVKVLEVFDDGFVEVDDKNINLLYK